MHDPVLINSFLSLLTPKITTLVDCTYGGGGHSLAALNKGCKRLVALDRDQTININNEILNKYNDKEIFFFNDKFSNLDKYHNYFPLHQETFILADLGMSNFQLQDTKRSFSHRSWKSQLNFNMDSNGNSVYDLINNGSSLDIYKVLKEYGEEPYSLQIADAIVQNRPVNNVKDLVYLIRCTTPYGVEAIKNALSRIFQSLRIYANDELQELDQLLQVFSNYSNINVGIISFHSLEDRKIKQWMKQHCHSTKLIMPTRAEIIQNPQSRSAKLRFGIVV